MLQKQVRIQADNIQIYNILYIFHIMYTTFLRPGNKSVYNVQCSIGLFSITK